MNNVKYYKSSLAYDFDMFMPKEQRTVEKAPSQIIPMPTRQKAAGRRVKTAKRAATGRVGITLVLIGVLLMVCANIYIRAEITSINSKIDKVKSEIVELESEEVRLGMELERKVSYANLEQAAKDLGMQKIEKSQMVYIRTNTNEQDILQASLDE